MTNDILKIGSGVEISEHEDSYVLRVMKNINLGKTKSGKSILHATTHGEAVLPNGEFLNLNFYSKIEAKPVPSKKVMKKLTF